MEFERLVKALRFLDNIAQDGTITAPLQQNAQDILDDIADNPDLVRLQNAILNDGAPIDVRVRALRLLGERLKSFTQIHGMTK